MPLEKDVEWSIRDLIYRNHEIDMIVNRTDIIALLQNNYHEYKDSSTEELSQTTDAVLIHLVKGGVLTSADQNEPKYKITSIPNRYQCTECNQISYIGEKEDKKCFSCESENLMERNVR